MGSKAVTKADDVEGLSTLIHLRNPGNLEVSVEALDQPLWNVEERDPQGQSCGDRAASAFGFLLESAELGGEPFPEVSHEIAPEGNLRAISVFFVRRLEDRVGCGAFELQLPDGEGSKLAPSEARQYQCLVDQCSLPAKGFELVSGFRSHLCPCLTFPPAPVDRLCFMERTGSRCLKEPHKLGLR